MELAVNLVVQEAQVASQVYLVDNSMDNQEEDPEEVAEEEPDVSEDLAVVEADTAEAVPEEVQTDRKNQEVLISECLETSLLASARRIVKMVHLCQYVPREQQDYGWKNRNCPS